MHPLISIAVPTRHRPECMKRFIESLHRTALHKKPHLTVLLDAPEKSCFPDKWEIGTTVSTIKIFEKSSLTELWNWGIITAPTDWVLLCNDDIEFKPGWIEYLENQIATGKYLQINLGHYGAFCIHKSLILKIGWHDERYRGGGYEDIDWQLRLSEAGLKDKVDNSHTFYQNNPGHDIGSFIDHFKDGKNEGWQGNGNDQWICRKWSRHTPHGWNRIASTRAVNNIDWHPSYTKRYEKRYAVPKFFHTYTPLLKKVFP